MQIAIAISIAGVGLSQLQADPSGTWLLPLRILGTVVVPVSITYPGMRSGSNMISRLMTRFKGPLDPRLLDRTAKSKK